MFITKIGHNHIHTFDEIKNCSAKQTWTLSLLMKVTSVLSTEYPKKVLQYCRKYDFQGFRSMVFLQYHMMLSDPAEIQVSEECPSRPLPIHNPHHIVFCVLLLGRIFCQVHRCCTRNTCTPSSDPGWVMGCLPVPVPGGWSIKRSTSPPSNGRPSRDISEWFNERVANSSRSLVPCRKHRKSSTPRS